MAKKMLALLLSLAMLCGLMAGCGSSSDASADAPESTAVSEEAETEPEEEAPAAPAEETAVAEEAAPGSAEEAAPASAEEETAEPAAEASVYTGTTVKGLNYPVGDPDNPEEFSIFMSWPSMFDEYLSSWNELPRLADVTAATGVKINFHEVSSASASEQFNLMIASGDMDDIIQAADYYVGGLGAAYSDEVIYDLTDMVEENCPIYYDLVMNIWNQATRDVVLTSGKFLGINTLKDEVVSDMGLLVRGDWLDELGLETPSTLDEFVDMLYAIHDKYGCDQTIYVNNTGEVQNMDGVYGVSMTKISGATDVAPYLKDGEVVSGIVSDEYREWLVLFNQMYEDGIIGQDFYGNESTDADVWSHVSSESTAVWRIGADSMHLVPDYVENPDAYAVAIPKLVKNAGDKYLMGQETAAADNKGFSITTSCDNPELVLQYFDWFYTDEGVILTNYGIEGETFNYDENGTPRYTEMITEPENMTMMVAVITNTFSQLPMLNIVSKMWSGYTAEEEAAIHLWSDTSNDDTSRAYPSGAALTSDETLSISNQMNALLSYSSETILKFMTGALEINDDNWSEFVDNCYSQGLQDCLDVYNNAYSQYLAGERASTTSGGGGGGEAPPDGGEAPDGPPPD